MQEQKPKKEGSPHSPRSVPVRLGLVLHLRRILCLPSAVSLLHGGAWYCLAPTRSGSHAVLLCPCVWRNLCCEFSREGGPPRCCTKALYATLLACSRGLLGHHMNLGMQSGLARHPWTSKL